MSNKHPANDYYCAARKLLPEMDDAMRQSIEELLKQAEEGRQTDSNILEILAGDQLMQRKFREALNLEGETVMGGEFSSLAGNVVSPVARKYVCPVAGHNYIRRIQKAGDDPGLCPEHKVVLIPIEEKGNK